MTRKPSVLACPFVAAILFTVNLTVLTPSPVLAQQSKQTIPFATGTTVSFRPVVTYSSGEGVPSSVAVADLNHGGKLDVAVANATTVGVLLGNGDGTLNTAKIYLSGTTQSSIALGDFNGDGVPDAVTSGESSTVPFAASVLLGNGTGGFQAVAEYSSGGFDDNSVAVADLNGDGKLDIAVGNWDSGIGVLLGNGNGTFMPAVTYSSGNPANAIAIADVNLDGKPDLVMQNQAANTVDVLLGNGDGTFQSAVSFSTGGDEDAQGLFGGESIAVADVNGDGKPDVVVVNSGSNTVSVLLGNGDGTFQTAVPYSTGGTYPDGVAIADLNGDGKPDLVVVNRTEGTVAVLIGDGNGTFLLPAVQFASGGSNPNWVAVADLNGDGRPDLIVANEDSGTVGVLINDTTTAACTGQCPTSTTLTTSLNPSIYGQTVTFTATVTPTGSIPPTGKVTFSWSGYVLDTAALDSSGVATFTISDLNADPYPMIATYKGNANNLGSTSAIVNQVVTQTTSSATLTSSPNPSNVGEAVTFTAQITSPTVTAKGPVTFTVGKTVLGTVELNSGKAKLTTSSLPAGSSTVTVVYQGDSNIRGSSASVTQVVGQSETSTTTALAYSVNNSTLRETFTAKVTSSGGIPTGTVSFTVGNVTLGSAQLNNGKATLTVPTLSVGSNTVDANYAGNSQFAASSAWITQTFVMPVTGTLYLQQEGGSAAATTSFGTGTSAKNLVFYYTGLPNNPNPTGEVTLGTFTAGTLVNFGMYTTFGSQSGYAFSTGTDQASLVAFADLSNSLGMNHGVTQQTSSTTWLLHLDDAVSYLYDDDNNDVLMELIVVPQ
jgi:Bacterial Ig-like domain (group 3)/FG-GAP-like repeat/FG-GAP repeat